MHINMVLCTESTYVPHRLLGTILRRQAILKVVLVAQVAYLTGV